MLATILVLMPLMLLSFVQLPEPQRHPATGPDCELEVLTPLAIEERALAQFDAAIDHYVTLHRRLERSLPPEQMFDDPEDMFAARDALRSAILDARPNARQGNMFTPAVANVLRDRLSAAIVQHKHNPADVLAAIGEERLPGMPEPKVNREYTWGIGSAMWPTLLRALPELADELEYRFSGRNLILIDVHANLVVDILEDALPDAKHR